MVVHANTVLTVAPELAAQARKAVELYATAQQLSAQGRRDDAISHYQQAIHVYPGLAGAYNNMAMLVFERGDAVVARQLLEQGARVANATGDAVNFAAMHNNIGFIIREENQQSISLALDAIAHFDVSLEAVPDDVGALYNKASALHCMRRDVEAEALLRRVIAVDPRHVSAHTDLGAIHFARGDHEQAIYHQDQVINNPMATTTAIMGAFNNKGHFYKENGFLVEALKVHEQALVVAPEDAMALGNIVTAQRTLCIWNASEELHDRLVDLIDNELRHRPRGVSFLPYDATLLWLSDAFRKRIAMAHSLAVEQAQTLELPVHQRQPGAPLKIGYLSFDFREHPMGHLTLGLLEHHRATRVEHLCYSYGPNDGSEWRQRAERSCTMFTDLVGASDIDAAIKIAIDDLDILVDLMAHTKGARLGISALRPTRQIVNYLGFPGTMGSTFTDYAIVDRYVVPPEAATTMTERLVYLPHTYQVNLYDLDIPACAGVGGSEPMACQQHGRTANGLPADGIVFCNFNTIDKMEPVSFTAWMNILRRVPNSVLWLLEPAKRYAEQIKNVLLHEAEARGIHPSRVIFAPHQPKKTHLARLSVADIFLDSFVYNAHSTASDALWAFLPIVTLWGNTFPSRVAASLIKNSMRYPDIVVDDLKSYENAAVILAENPSLLHQIRQELAAQSLKSPLFDTDRTVAEIESSYELMAELSIRGEGNPRFHMIVHPQRSSVFTDPRNLESRFDAALREGMALQHRGNISQALTVYERMLNVNPSHGDVRHLFGAALFQLGHPMKARMQLRHVVNQYSGIDTFRLNLGVVHFALNEIDLAIEQFLAALRINSMNTEAFRRLLDAYERLDMFAPQVDAFDEFGSAILASSNISDAEREQLYLRYSFVLSKVSRIGDAIQLLETALQRFPQCFRLGFNLAALLAADGQYDSAELRMTDTAVTEIKHEFAERGRFIMKHLRPTGSKVVALYCHEYGQTWWNQWGPLSLAHGLGGSEEAVVFLSRELVRLGYHVEVFGNPPSESVGIDDHGVHWYPHYAFDHQDQDIDVFVAWRYHISLSLAGRASQKVFWMHDMPPQELLHSQMMLSENVRIVCVSAFQASRLPLALQRKVTVITNALDPTYWRDAENDRNVFVYGSAPNRGLYHVLTAWPTIKQHLPQAKLQIYYGFTDAFVTWGMKHIANFREWRADIERMMTDFHDVEYVGLVDHATLSMAYAKAGFYLFPTSFSETSCVSLMKAMANGAVPITSRFPNSALSETCDGYDLGPRALGSEKIESDPQWLTLWVDSIIAAWHDTPSTEQLRVQMKTFARSKYRWSRVAAQWHHFLIPQASTSTPLITA
ncbi:TPA: hypothetical protein N0F65_008739 [Lagenidium giganteum]|uniref:protein O-GlcNAc transferase n=1 Tax=Lagenidium giganteum TaxID=4803 RepID=A0AAV2YZ08_9STRA|nr:TPA: hypothetical protein N0F65_008739 [Lagenidium giganteum]